LRSDLRHVLRTLSLLVITCLAVFITIDRFDVRPHDTTDSNTMRDFRIRPTRDRARIGVDIIDAISEPIEAALQNARNFRERRELIKSLTPGQRAILLTSILNGIVENGGFSYWLSAEPACFGPEVVESLRLIGADHHAQLVLDAMRELPDSAPADDVATRVAQLDRLSDAARERIEDLSELFFRANEGVQSLEQLQWQYVTSHPSEFFTE
jgi:hypothetical protein